MRRALLLGLALLVLLSGCSAQLRAMNTQYAQLQNPAYPGDANKDFDPYKAKKRDSTACADADATQRALSTAAPGADFWESFHAAMQAWWTVYLNCMAYKGWRVMTP